MRAQNASGASLASRLRASNSSSLTFARAANSRGGLFTLCSCSTDSMFDVEEDINATKDLSPLIRPPCCPARLPCVPESAPRGKLDPPNCLHRPHHDCIVATPQRGPHHLRPRSTRMSLQIEILPVFISSTWIDLRPEHESAERAVNSMRETKYVGMKYFGARDEDTR